tara:strand:- start:416 stop:685 length:270 start_codon:yes stop_codon:yes gene_type:complete
MEFICPKDGFLDDKSIGFISAVDIAGDEVHLPNVKSSAVVKFFADFLEIHNVLREKETGVASKETMNYLRKIHTKISGWIKQEDEEDKT